MKTDKIWCPDIEWWEGTNVGWKIYDTQLVPDGWRLCPICGKERPKELGKLAELFLKAQSQGYGNVYWQEALSKVAIEAVFEVIDGYKELHGVYSMSGLKQEIREKLA